MWPTRNSPSATRHANRATPTFASVRGARVTFTRCVLASPEQLRTHVGRRSPTTSGRLCDCLIADCRLVAAVLLVGGAIVVVTCALAKTCTCDVWQKLVRSKTTVQVVAEKSSHNRHQQQPRIFVNQSYDERTVTSLQSSHHPSSCRSSAETSSNSNPQL